MKNAMFLFAAVAGCLGVSCAQNISQSQVPSLVLNTFQQSYPQATDIEWEKQAAVYNVEFEIGKTDHELWIDEKGKVIKHEEDVPKNMIPSGIQNAISTNYSGAKVDDVDKIEEGGNTYYNVEFDNWAGDKYVRFKEDGTVIR